MAEYALELTAHEFDLFTREGTVLINFFNDWCMNSMVMLPLVEDLAEEMHGVAKVGKVNLEDCEQFKEKFKIHTTPTFAIFKNGKMQEQFSGEISFDELKEKIENHI
jgi:thioredoxin 1